MHENAQVIKEVKALTEELASLQKKNSVLQSNFNKLKVQSSFIQASRDKLMAQCQQLQRDKFTLKFYFKRRAQAWKREIDFKLRQLMETRSQVLMPSDIHEPCLHIMEEIKSSSKKGSCALESRCQKINKLYAQLNQELENLRTRHAIDEAQVLVEKERTKMRHHQELDHFQKELQISKELVSCRESDFASLQTEIYELFHNSSGNLISITDHDELRRLLTAAAVSIEDLQMELKKRALIADKLEKLNNYLRERAVSAQKDFRCSTTKLQSAERKILSLKKRFDEQQKEHSADVKCVRAEAARRRANLEAEILVERGEIEAQLSGFRKRLESYDIVLKNVQDDCETKISAACQHAARLRCSVESNKLESAIKLNTLYTDVEAWKMDFSRASSEASGLRESFVLLENFYKHEIPSLRNAIARYKTELVCERLRVSELRKHLELERADKLRVAAASAKNAIKVHDLLATLEQKRKSRVRETNAIKKAWQKEGDYLVFCAKEVAAAGTQSYCSSLRRAKRKLKGKHRKKEGVSVEMMPLLEERSQQVTKSMKSMKQTVYATKGLALHSFDDELSALKNRQRIFSDLVSKNEIL